MPAALAALIGTQVAVLLLWLLATSASRALALRRVRRIEIARGDRIGVFVDCGDSPTHTHYGTLPFSNSRRAYRYDWHLKAELMKAAAGRIAEAELTVVDLQTEGIKAADLAGLIELNFGNWQVRDDALLRRLRSQFRLKALVVVKEARVKALSEGGGDSAPWVGYAEGTGLFRRAVFWRVRYFAVAAYRWNVHWLDPPADFALARPLSSMLEVPSVRMKNFSRPVDFGNMTAHELEPVRRQVLMFIDRTALTAIHCLKSRAGI